jgi:hypothetical protein
MLVGYFKSSRRNDINVSKIHTLCEMKYLFLNSFFGVTHYLGVRIYELKKIAKN